jgi:DNA-binding NarL/FixJ family response regulator
MDHSDAAPLMTDAICKKIMLILFATPSVIRQPRRRRNRLDQLERRRMQVAKLLDRGLSQADVARQFKVIRESVRRWWNQILLHGFTH